MEPPVQVGGRRRISPPPHPIHHINDAHNVKRYFQGIRLSTCTLNGVRRFLPALLVAALVLLCVRGCFVTQVVVDAGAEMPGLMPGDRIMVGRTAYGLRLPIATRGGARHFLPKAPERGEWCVAEHPTGSGHFCLLQITALPGDTVSATPERPDAPRYVLPQGMYAAGTIVLRHADLIGRPLCITYSVDPEAPWYKCLRPERYFSGISR